jgi:hypothetical protein
MAITYPIALPTAQGFRRVTIAPRSNVAIYASPFTGQQQVYQHPGQFLTCSMELPPMDRASAADFVAAMLSLQGIRGTFLFGDPAWSGPQGTAGGFPRVKGANQTGSTLITEGWPISQAAVLRPGDWLQIGSQNILTRSEDFTHANWSGAGVTVTGNHYVAPDGATTADRLAATATDSFIGQSRAIPSPGNYTFSIWLRSDTGTVDLTIFIPQSGAGVLASFPITVTTTFQRFEFPFFARTVGDVACQIGGASTFTTGETIGAWGAQLNQGATAMAYQTTTSAAVATNPQLCLATAGASSDGSGDATLEIFPRIRTAFAANTPITVNNPVGLWRMTDDGSFLQDVDSLTRGIVINAVEAF